MAEDQPKIRITPRARAIYHQLKAATDPLEIANLSCNLHSAVGLFPWSAVSTEQVLAEFEPEQKSARKRVPSGDLAR